jgi:hypothetical protein
VEAEAYGSLADALEAAGRAREAMYERAQSVRPWLQANDTARAESLQLSLLERAAVVLRDADLADTVHTYMTPRDHLGDHFVECTTDEYLFALALAEILKGVPGAPKSKSLATLEARAAAELSQSHRGQSLACKAALLRAEKAVSDVALDDAAREFQQHAELETDNLAKMRSRLRALLYGGLQGQAPEALTEIAELNIPEELQEERLRALGWLAVASGDIDRGLTAFHGAARIAIGRADTRAAAVSFRCIEWAERQRRLTFGPTELPGRIAYRLERRAAELDAVAKASVDRLIRNVDHALMESDYREAVFTGLAAQRLAYDEINPAGVERARDKLRHAWLPIVEEANDAWTLGWAAYFAGCSRADLQDDRAKRQLRTLLTALRSRASQDTIEEVVKVCAEEPLGPVERTGMLLLLADMADLLTKDLVGRHLVSVLVRALDRGWGIVTRANQALAACRLIQKCSHLLDGPHANSIVAALLRLGANTPAAYADDLHRALAQLLTNAEIAGDEAVASAQFLYGFVERTAAGSRSYATEHAEVGLSVLLPRLPEDLQTRIWSILRQDASRGHWTPLSQLAHQGTTIPIDLLEGFLRAEAAVAESLSKPVDGKSYGPRFPPPGALTEAAANGASSTAIASALDASLKVLSQERQWSRIRAQWIGFVVRLLRAAPARIPEALPVLAKLAAGRFEEPGSAGVLPRHPLSTFRFLGASDDAQADAVHGIGALYPHSGHEEQREISSVLANALENTSPDVRVSAVYGYGEILADRTMRARGAPNELREQVIKAVLDSDPAVRDAAVEVLRWESRAAKTA